MTGCDEIEPLLGELALGVLADDRRSAVLDHVGICLGCRALLLELAATGDALLLACPPAEPSGGFDAAVMARAGAMRRPRRSRRSRRPILAGLVAAAVLVAGGLAVGVRLDRREELRTVPLVAPGGGGVGDAISYAGRPAWVFMRVDRALPDGTYRCVVTTGGSPVEIGTLVVAGGEGGWGRPIAADPGDLRTVRLETADGTVVASASFR